MKCFENAESEKTATQHRSMTKKKPAQIPETMGILPRKPWRIPALMARILLGPGVNAVINVNAKKAENTAPDIGVSLFFVLGKKLFQGDTLG